MDVQSTDLRLSKVKLPLRRFSYKAVHFLGEKILPQILPKSETKI
jgi:hypothetical protein